MSCTPCGQAIQPSEAHLPCPRCGSIDRNVAVADDVTAIDEVTGLEVQLPRAPAPWQQMWAEVRHRLDTLRSWYSGEQDMNINELTAVSIAFFVSCYHLAEHIKADPAVPQSARAQVRNYANSSSSLKLSADIANTYKHSARNPGERACGISDVRTSLSGAVVTFTWTDAQGNSHHEDCLNLAERAVMSWIAFLRRHGL